MNILDPIRSDFQALARVLAHNRPTCPLERAERLAGHLIAELADSGHAPYPDVLRAAIFRKPQDAFWVSAVENWLPKIRPGFCYVDRERTVGERFATSSAMATVGAHISLDPDAEYVLRAWCDLTDEARDKIVRIAREAKP